MTETSTRRSLPKAYEPAAVEGPTGQRWLDRGYFTPPAKPPPGAAPFAIVLPPPNVTGVLHIGHALDHTFPDYLVRFHRMRGDDVLWLPGMDHAGIATQNVVERELAKEGLTRFDLGREAFVDRVWEWKKASGGTILSQMRRLGDSVDWTRERFTMDEGLSRAVRHVFVSLYEQGMLYRGKRIINWCPRCLTALSDIEVEHEEVDGELATLRYPLAGDPTRYVEVATTRAETMLGDTAVAVHPDDERYGDLIGRTVRLPLMDREIPIVADDAVDRSFGTGAVKVTPAHDPNDYEIAQRHDLPAIEIMDEHAVINANGGRFEGLDRYAARKAVKEALAAEGLLGEVKAERHSVGHCYRCHTEIEPRLSLQWFVRTAPLAAKAMDTVRSGETKIVPERFNKEFFTWMENIRDWCVSRQIWWGHRIPAWYCAEGHVIVARETPTACAECGSDELVQDEDVLDTWFSSGLWPFSTMGWPEDTPDLDRFYPTSVLVTGYDILFFWVARMMMFGCHFMPPTPFRTVALHGMVRDANGRKMSKSFGNVIDPIALMDRYGTDATRFALLRGANPGGDVPLAEEWVEGARNFTNKLWNAARYILSVLPEEAEVAAPPAPGTPERTQLTLADRWLLSRLERTRAAVTAAYENFDPAEGARLLFAFTWSELADWAIELAKPRAEQGGQEQATAAGVLAYAMDGVVRLLHPLMPFVTEELGRSLRDTETITLGPWPAARPEDIDAAAEAEMAVLQEAISTVRRFRSEHQVPPSRKPPLVVVPADAAQRALFDAEQVSITRLARLEGLHLAERADAGNGAQAKLLAAGAELYLPLEGLMDLDAELDRLRREREKLVGELARAHGKLANEDFVAKAPAAIVDKARARVDEVTSALAKVDAQVAELGG